MAAGMQSGVFDHCEGLAVGDHRPTSDTGDGVRATGLRCFHGDSPTPSLQGTRITAGRAQVNAVSNDWRNSSGVAVDHGACRASSVAPGGGAGRRAAP